MVFVMAALRRGSQEASAVARVVGGWRHLGGVKNSSYSQGAGKSFCMPTTTATTLGHSPEPPGASVTEIRRKGFRWGDLDCL